MVQGGRLAGQPRPTGRSRPRAAPGPGAAPRDVLQVEPDPVQVMLRPRIESTSTSAGSSSGQTSGWRAFHRSRPSSASALVLARAISISGLVDLRRPVGLGGRPRAGGTGPGGTRRRHCRPRRRRCPAAPAASTAGRAASSPVLLLVVRRPRRVRQPGRLVARGQLEQRRRATRRPRPCPPTGRRADAKRAGTVSIVNAAGSHARHLVPGQRRRHARVRQRPDRVGGRDGAVLGVLVVVDEDPVPLLLPPLRRGQVGSAPLDLPRHRHRRPAHVGERPAGRDPRVDVHAARPRRLRPPGQPEVGQHRPGHQRDGRLICGHSTPGTGSRSTRSSSGWSRSRREHRVRVEVDAAEVDHPGQPGRVPQHHLVGGPAGREPQLGGLDPVRARTTARASGRTAPPPPRSRTA